MKKSDIIKNLLDLRYNKHMQSFQTSVFIFYTFFIGALIALITNQIDLNNSFLLLILICSTLFITLICGISMFLSKQNMSDVYNKIKNIRCEN